MDNVFINDGDIKVLDRIDRGGYAVIFNAVYKKEKMALKTFFDSSIIGQEESLKLIDIARNKDDFSEFLVIPKYLVGEDKKVRKYLTERIDGGSFFSYINAKPKEKLIMLRKARDVIADMHKQGIVHGELHLGNMLYDGNNAYIIDFDKCQYGDYQMVNEDYFLAKTYMDINGVDPSIDIFIFNLATYALLNNLATFASRCRCLEGDYGCLNNVPNIKKICKMIGNFEKNNEFLIDYILDDFLEEKRGITRIKNFFIR